MIPVVCPFGLIQKDQKIKTVPAGPELRYGTQEKLKRAALRQQIFLVACLRSVYFVTRTK